MDPIPPTLGTAAGFVVLLLAHLLRGQDGRRHVALLLAAAAAPVALFTANGLAGGEFSLPPTDFRGWTLALALGSLLLGWVAAQGRAAAALAAGASLAALAYLFLVPTESLHERYWDGQVALYAGSLAGVSAATLLLRYEQVRRERVGEGLLAFAIAGVAAAPTLGFTGTGVGAALAGAVAGGAGLLGLLTTFLGDRWRLNLGPLGMALGTSQALVMAGVLATGVLYAETPKESGLALALAPLLTLLPGRGLKGTLLRLTLVAAVAAAPAIHAYLNQPPPNPYG